jgi:hypothetical protein
MYFLRSHIALQSFIWLKPYSALSKSSYSFCLNRKWSGLKIYKISFHRVKHLNTTERTAVFFFSVAIKRNRYEIISIFIQTKHTEVLR